MILVWVSLSFNRSSRPGISRTDTTRQKETHVHEFQSTTQPTKQLTSTRHTAQEKSAEQPPRHVQTPPQATTNNLPQPFIAFVDAVYTYKHGDLVLFTMASKSYARAAANWAANLHALNVTSGYFIAGIGEACKDVQNLFPPAVCQTIPGAHYSGFGGAMGLRLQLIISAVEAGVNVMHSDADAIWIRSPFETNSPFRSKQVDIVASRGTFPGGANKKFGFGGTVCCGLIRLNSSPGTRAILQTAMKIFVNDDQIAINNALVKANIGNWTKVPLEDDQGIAMMGRISHPPALVSILPYTTVVRHCKNWRTHSPHAYNLHCLTPKEGNAKEQAMKANNVWLLL